MGKTGFQSTNNPGRASQPHTHRSYGEILGSAGSYQPNNHNSQFSRGNQNHSSQHHTREQNHYDNNSSASFRNYGYQPRGPMQSHARFDERYNQQYSPPIYPPTPSLNSSFPEALSKSLLQIVENQSRTIEAMKASQEAQAEAYKEMSRTNKMEDDNALFNSIEVYERSNPAKFEKWIDSIDQATHITGRDLRKELLKKSDRVIRNSLTMIDATWSDNDIIAKLHQDFSSLSTMNKAREELKSLYQEPREPITVFIYKYGHMHFLSTGIKAERETHPFANRGFISALEPQLNRIVVKRYTDARNKLCTLEEVFQLAEQYSRKMQEANSLGHSSSLSLQSSMNEISNAEVNEVTQGCWNNYNKTPRNKQDNYKGKKDSDKKPWFNKDQKPWNKDNKYQGNKESKSKDTSITVTKDMKYFCPTGYHEGIFSAVTKLLSEKTKQAKWSGDANAKTINAIECEYFCSFFKIPEELYDGAFTQVFGELTPKILGNDTD